MAMSQDSRDAVHMAGRSAVHQNRHWTPGQWVYVYRRGRANQELHLRDRWVGTGIVVLVNNNTVYVGMRSRLWRCAAERLRPALSSEILGKDLASPVLLCTTKLAQSTSQYFFVLQSLQEVLPSTTLYYKTCTKHVPVLLCTTKLARSTSQYNFVLESLHKVLPSTTLYYKACASMSQYYFVLQTLHKVLPSTTLHYKACTRALPSATLYYKACTNAQSTSQYYGKRLHTQKLLHREAFTHNKLLDTKSFTHREAATQQAFTYKIFHTEQAFAEKKITQRSFLVQMTQASQHC